MTSPAPRRTAGFDRVRELGVAWPDVTAETKYDGSPLLRCRGCFMAGVAMHGSAEPDTIVVRIDEQARALLLVEGADTYYITDYYEPHPVVLVRLGRIDREALHDLLSMARRATLRKAGFTAESRPSR